MYISKHRIEEGEILQDTFHNYRNGSLKKIDCNYKFVKIICKNCFYIIKYDVLPMAENMSNKSNDYKRDTQNDEIKSIVLWLFALIGFIILIYSIFMGAVGEPLASVADTVFVAAIIGSFTLVGTIVGRAFLKK